MLGRPIQMMSWLQSIDSSTRTDNQREALFSSGAKILFLLILAFYVSKPSRVWVVTWESYRLKDNKRRTQFI